VVVIGSGIGGLTSAGLLAKQGKKVLVVERHDRPGGYAHSFRRRGYRFDSAVHVIGGCGDGPYEGSGLIRRLLEVMQVEDRCRFLSLDPFYTAVYPDFRLDVPSGIDAFTERHVRAFPGEERGFRELMSICQAVRAESLRAPDLLSPTDFGRMASYVPSLVQYHRATVADVMADHLTDPHLMSVFGTLWPYLGLPPSKLSFLYWAMMLLSYVDDGAWSCEGGFQPLANAMAGALTDAGGELLLKSSVTQIVVERGEVAGVVLENGQRILAPVVVSNADATQTLTELVGAEHLPRRLLAGLRKMEPSLSAFVVYGATDLDLAAAGAAHEMFFYKQWDHDIDYENALSGKISRIGVTVPSLVDSTLAPAGEHVFTLTVLLPYSLSRTWRVEKEFFTDLLLTEADAVFPGLRDHLRFAEGATPRTMERYTRNLEGAIYGWDLRPSQVGPMRLGPNPPVEGLYLAGHWTAPGGGIYGVCQSGVHAAQTVLGYKREADLWGALSASLPGR
jgi:prolycopene isomerase